MTSALGKGGAGAKPSGPAKATARPLALIAAVARDGVIGSKTGRMGLPWHIPEDLKRFKRLTMAHAIIMGRTTHEAIGRALPKRRNIVLTRSPARVSTADVEVATSLDAALALVADDPLPFIIGGASVYAEALPLCTVLYLTEVARDVSGDAFFPTFARESFRQTERTEAETPDVVFVTLQRISEVELPSEA